MADQRRHTQSARRGPKGPASQESQVVQKGKDKGNEARKLLKTQDITFKMRKISRSLGTNGQRFRPQRSII